MLSLENLSDKQNMLLTQLSYESDVLKGVYEGMTLYEIAEVVPDNGTKELILDLCHAGLGSLRIKDVEHDYVSGFGAIAFTDQSGNTGFSYRGTDGLSWKSLNDWVDNLSTMITGTSIQTTQAEAFFDKNRDVSGNNYLYGHSKGGELSESVFVNNYSHIKGVHLLNPQPINPYALSADQLAAIRSDKVDIVIVERDYVWFLGKLPSYGNIRIINSNGKNSHLYESIEDQFDENGNLKPGQMPWWEFAAYFMISNATYGFQYVGGKIGFVYNCVVRIVDFVRNEFVPAALDFVTWVADGFKKFGDGVKSFVDDLKNFLSSTVERAKEQFKRALNIGYKYSVSNPYIKVNTDKLYQYAQRLRKVNNRLDVLDKRLDKLYWNIGLKDLWNLIQADILTDYSYRIKKCAGYLESTADDFDKVESDLLRKL